MPVSLAPRGPQGKRRKGAGTVFGMMIGMFVPLAVLLAGLAVGEPAPDFALPAEDGRVVRLSRLPRGPVVLAFFPKAFTPG